MKKITDIINRCLLVLLAVNAVAMFFFMDDIRTDTDSGISQMMVAGILLTIVFVYFVIGVVYPENRDEASGKGEKFLIFMEKLGLIYYGKDSNGADEKYIGPRECRRYWDPAAGTIFLVFYMMLAPFSLMGSGTIFLALTISAGILLILIIIVSVFWKLKDIYERTGEWHPWIAVKPIFITIGIFAICTVLSILFTEYMGRDQAVKMDEIRAEIEQAKNAQWDYSVEESDYMQMAQVIAKIKAHYGDESVYYKIMDGGQIQDPNGIDCEKISFVVTGEIEPLVNVFEFLKYGEDGYVLNGIWTSSVEREAILENYDGIF